MENLIKGQRLALSGLVTGNVVQLGLASAGVALDFACFGLDAAGKLSDDRYMTFFNQPRTPCGGVEAAAPSGDAAGFSYQLERLPASIERLVVTAASMARPAWRSWAAATCACSTAGANWPATRMRVRICARKGRHAG